MLRWGYYLQIGVKCNHNYFYKKEIEDLTTCRRECSHVVEAHTPSLTLVISQGMQLYMEEKARNGICSGVSEGNTAYQQLHLTPTALIADFWLAEL
jgi:hypothetical protein